MSIYIFDWGDTLMVDFPNEKDHMKNWKYVEAVSGARETLEFLSKSNEVFVATGAPSSKPEDIKMALSRVGLSQYITDYFCNTNLGVNKPKEEYYQKIVKNLNINPNRIIMVGDCLQKDILPCVKIGIQCIWFNPKKIKTKKTGFKQIHCLTELCS